MAVFPTQTTLSQAVTFSMGATSLATGHLDFGDGNEVMFDLFDTVVVKHLYERRGQFLARLVAINDSGQSTSSTVTVLVR
jgi:PKD domain